MATAVKAVARGRSDWPVEPLGSLGRWVGGGTPSKAEPAFWTNGTVPWVSAKDMKTAVIDRSADLITEEAVARSSAKRIPAGSVLCVMRSGILAHTFPVAVNVVEVTINQDLRALVVRAGVDPNYLAHFLRFSGSDILRSCSKHGTTVSSIEASRLDRYPIPLPDLKTQRRIVARIDELFSELDDGEEELARAHADLEIYRKALLKAAVTGELTADWRAMQPSASSGQELLAEIERNRAANVRGTKRRTTRDAKDSSKPDDLPSIPSTWCWTELATLVANEPNALTDGPFGSNLKSEHYVDAGPRVIRLQNISKDGQFVDAQAHIAPDHFARLGRHHVHAGDLVVAILGSPLPRAAIVPEAIGPALVKADCFKLRLAPQVESKFAWSWLNSVWVHHVCEELIHGVGRPRLGMAEIQSLPVPVPPTGEQREIVKAIAACERIYSEASDQLDDLASASATLRQSILAAAFRGELVQ